MTPFEPKSDTAGDGLLPEEALERFSAGTELRLWEVLGARPEIRGGAPGVRFGVWAPNAGWVGVTGDFNEWTRGGNPMRRRGRSGVWEAFVPGAGPGDVYKYEIHSRLGGRVALKSDPVALRCELRPRTGSVVAAPAEHDWGDAEWMAGRSQIQSLDRPISIYEVHLGSWKRRDGDGQEAGGFLQWDELAAELVPYVKDMGYTHLELLPVTEHPFDGSWGYQPTGYFAPTSRFGEPAGLCRLVDAAHGAGLGVFLDWVPAHFPRDAHGLGFFDGTPLYEHEERQRAVHPDWTTYVFDHGKPEVVSFLVSSALHWLERFHLDGLRVDAVASMIYRGSAHPEHWTPDVRGTRDDPDSVAFLRRLNDAVHERFPGVLTIAEESTSWPGVTASTDEGGLGFDLKWNMGWMNDTLSYFRMNAPRRRRNQRKVTFSLSYAFDEQHLLPLSHDEVVHGKASLISKMPGDREERFGNLRSLFGYKTAHPGKKLLFMGGEIGQWSEWSHDSSLQWDLLEHRPHRELHELVRELNRFYSSRPELWEVDGSWAGFEWLHFSEEGSSVVAFLRRGRDEARWLVIVANLAMVPRERFRLGVPDADAYRIAFSTEDERFGGVGTPSSEAAVEEVPAHGRPRSIELALPAHSVLFLEPSSGGAGDNAPGRRIESAP